MKIKTVKSRGRNIRIDVYINICKAWKAMRIRLERFSICNMKIGTYSTVIIVHASADCTVVFVYIGGFELWTKWLKPNITGTGH